MGSAVNIEQNGNRVVFDAQGSYIENVYDGSRLWMREAGGVYVLDMWVAPSDQPAKTPFQRPGDQP